jgi:hypothetical protein
MFSVMEVADVAVLAEMVREHYASDRLDPGVTEPTVVEHDGGSRSVVLPREQMFEPYRSFRLIDAATIGSVLVITFRWDDGADDGTIFLMPLDTRDIDLDMTDNIAVSTFLSHHLEFTLGGPRESWERARTTPFGPRFTIVRPYTQGQQEVGNAAAR